MTAVDFTKQDMNAAINAALSKVRDPRWTRAIERAALHLSTGRFLFDGTHAVLPSATTNQTYTVDSHTLDCPCKATGPCWHAAAALLLRRAAERHASQGVVYMGQYYTAAQLERSRRARAERGESVLVIPPRKVRSLAEVQEAADGLFV